MSRRCAPLVVEAAIDKVAFPLLLRRQEDWLLGLRSVHTCFHNVARFVIGFVYGNGRACLGRIARIVFHSLWLGQAHLVPRHATLAG